MSKKSEELEQDSLANRWSTTSNPAAGSSAVCTSRSAGPLGRLLIDNWMLSISNNSNSVAANITASLRNSAIGGTLIAQIRFQVPASSSKEGNYLDFPGVPAKIGQAVFCDMTGSNASVTQNILVAGWEDAQR